VLRFAVDLHRLRGHGNRGVLFRLRFAEQVVHDVESPVQELHASIRILQSPDHSVDLARTDVPEPLHDLQQQ
jgi:hypothetical protein